MLVLAELLYYSLLVSICDTHTFTYLGLYLYLTRFKRLTQSTCSPYALHASAILPIVLTTHASYFVRILIHPCMHCYSDNLFLLHGKSSLLFSLPHALSFRALFILQLQSPLAGLRQSKDSPLYFILSHVQLITQSLLPICLLNLWSIRYPFSCIEALVYWGVHASYRL